MRVPAGLTLVLILSMPAFAQDSTAVDSMPADTAVAPPYTVVEEGAVSVNAELKPRRTTKPLTVGDRFDVEVTVRHHRDARVSDPFIDDPGEFLVLDHGSKTRYEGDTIVGVHTLKMAVFAPGEQSMPGFLVTWQDSTGLLAVRTDTLGVEVSSVMPEGMEDINDLKPQIPFPNLLPLWLTIGIVGIAVLGIVAWRLIRRWRRKRQEAEPLPEPWEEALASLAAIPVKDWLSRGYAKRYYYAVSEILKRYLTRRYGFPALDQTTSEMVLTMKRERIVEREDFVTFFRRADLVKYAKLVPEMPEMEAAVVQARDLVNRTTPEPEPAKPATDAGNKA
jgi:hypothetical protein